MTPRKPESNPAGNRESVPDTIARLLLAQHFITSPQVAAAAGVTRQDAHYHLSRLVRRGVLVSEGARRSTRYRLLAQRSTAYSLTGPTESDMWLTERAELFELDPRLESEPLLQRALNFAFTEMANNAREHSHGTSVEVRWILQPDLVAFELEDDGIGAFASIRISRGLASDFQAVGELSKGKQTTNPSSHSGLGIFLTSRLVDRFVLSANEYAWTVSSAEGDWALGALENPRVGTLVRCEVRRDSTRTLTSVMDTLADDRTGHLGRTRLQVGLFQESGFVSRSQAKLLGARLEAFDTVELDFAGVDEVGQGFVDELFRVWAREHPQIKLVPLNANPAVSAMIQAASSSNW